MTEPMEWGESLVKPLWGSLGNPSCYPLLYSLQPLLIKLPWNIFEQSLNGLIRYAVNDYLGDMRA